MSEENTISVEGNILKNKNTIFKRNFRWIFEASQDDKIIIPKDIVQTCTRPQGFYKGAYDSIFTVEIYDIHHPEVIYIKQNWKKFQNVKVVISILDGCYTELEKWELFNCKTSQIDFSKLDYSNNDAASFKLYFQIKTDDVKITYFDKFPV